MVDIQKYKTKIFFYYWTLNCYITNYITFQYLKFKKLKNQLIYESEPLSQLYKHIWYSSNFFLKTKMIKGIDILINILFLIKQSICNNIIEISERLNSITAQLNSQLNSQSNNQFSEDDLSSITNDIDKKIKLLYNKFQTQYQSLDKEILVNNSPNNDSSVQNDTDDCDNTSTNTDNESTNTDYDSDDDSDQSDLRASDLFSAIEELIKSNPSFNEIFPQIDCECGDDCELESECKLEDDCKKKLE
jgi:hypothetical protein